MPTQEQPSIEPTRQISNPSEHSPRREEGVFGAETGLDKTNRGKDAPKWPIGGQTTVRWTNSEALLKNAAFTTAPDCNQSQRPAMRHLT
jgi:hypothetical protein